MTMEITPIPCLADNYAYIIFDDSSKTENTRVSYPLNHINNSMVAKGSNSTAGHPEKIIFLTL